MNIYHSEWLPTFCELGDIWINGEKHFVWSVIGQKKETVITEEETYTVIKPTFGWHEITREEAEKRINCPYYG